jgi:signal transduction histidine kinase
MSLNESYDPIGAHGCVFDRTTLEIRFCTPALAKLLGVDDPTQLVGRVVLDLFVPDSFEAFEVYLRKWWESDGALCTLMTSGSDEHRVAVHLSLANTALDEMAMFCIPVPDERARILALEETNGILREQNERLREFSTLVGHNIRNSLQVVVSSVDLVKAWQGGTLDVRADHQLDRIQRSAHGMNAILDGVMKYFRFDIGDYPMELTDINFIVDGLRSSLPSPEGRTVLIRRATELPSLVCAPQLIQELFTNVVGNSIKYSEKDPIEIEIGLNETEGSDTVFYVRDNGVGIENDDLSRVFMPFGRADRRGLNTTGMGMGMVLVKKIVARHGGAVWIESKVDHGTTISFTLSGIPRAGG